MAETLGDGWYYPDIMTVDDLAAMLKSWHAVGVGDSEDSDDAFRWCRAEFGVWLSDDFTLSRSDSGEIVVQLERGRDQATIARDARWDVEFSYEGECELFVFRHERDAVAFKLRWG